MRKSRIVMASLVFVALALGNARPAAAQFYAQHNLVSDGAIPADMVDTQLVNAWGLAAGPTTFWWVANNQTGVATLYDGNTGAKESLTVTVPGAPTGTVFNGGSGFVVSDGTTNGPSRFLFASEDGTISGWNPSVPANSKQAFVVVDNSANGAVYKGLAIASTPDGDFLYATNFRAGTVDVFDSNFAAVPGGFIDPDIPEHYAPFGIANLGGRIYVTYALQDADAMDDVPGEGHGYVDVFDTEGNLLARVASKGPLNSPWGLAMAPDSFGKFSGDLLIGNFGNGHINAFDPIKRTGRGEFQHRGPLHSADGPPLMIDGLWSLAFGNDNKAGPKDVLFFTAGPFDESHGLFGTLVPSPPPGRR